MTSLAEPSDVEAIAAAWHITPTILGVKDPGVPSQFTGFSASPTSDFTKSTHFLGKLLFLGKGRCNAALMCIVSHLMNTKVYKLNYYFFLLFVGFLTPSLSVFLCCFAFATIFCLPFSVK